jgi:hypothetical protein
MTIEQQYGVIDLNELTKLYPEQIHKRAECGVVKEGLNWTIDECSDLILIIRADNEQGYFRIRSEKIMRGMEKAMGTELNKGLKIMYSVEGFKPCL